jgi:hypothetical protein
VDPQLRDHGVPHYAVGWSGVVNSNRFPYGQSTVDERPFRNTGFVARSVLVLSLVFLPLGVLAAEPPARPSSPPTEQNRGIQAEQPDPNQPYFSQSKPRWFFSSRALVGLGFGRLTLNSGYGKPHFIWAGPEFSSALSPEFAALFAGAHVSIALIDLEVFARRTYPFTRGRITDTRTVTSEQLEGSDTRPPNDTLDATLSGVVPYRALLGCWETTYIRPLHLDDEELVYDEMQRIVVGSRGLLTLKLAPMFRVLPRDRLYVGVMVEYLSLLGRDDPTTLRVGPTFWSKLTNHLELGSYLTWPVVGSDRLDVLDSTFGTIALVYKFATGDPWSHFP